MIKNLLKLNPNLSSPSDFLDYILKGSVSGIQTNNVFALIWLFSVMCLYLCSNHSVLYLTFNHLFAI